MALRSSADLAPTRSIAASLERTLPPAWPSVVEDAISNCSAAARRKIASSTALPAAWRTMHAILIWCIAIDQRGGGAGLAKDVADVGDARRARRLRRPSVLGTMMPKSRCLRISAKASSGKRASASTAPACALATAAAARARANQSSGLTANTRSPTSTRCESIMLSPSCGLSLCVIQVDRIMMPG